ncbi:MFS transporter [Pectinatus haikarae]|uniref:MFS family permease n=1 Tax=Pectinatus haikarae TaxID=349096 RepID=A0ABT9YB12_9FIRM|nr:MFS transporter [Pectinatus haikarae]MDQ0205023.1 MFS family permease [Pectinatus haikarae]
MNKSKLWTKAFVIDCIICFLVNLAYYLTMVIIADYTMTNLHASLGDAGFACGIFILGALFARLFVGRSIERLGTKKALYFGLILFLLSTLLNLKTVNLLFLFGVRFLQGIGFGVASTATGTIMAQIVPAERRGEGTSYYAMFVTLSTAIGPFLGIYLYQNGNLDNNLILGAILLSVSCIATFILVVPEVKLTKEQLKQMQGFSLGNFFERKAIPIAIITFFISIGFSSILGFITSFEKEINLIEAGKFFFLVYAVFAVASRPFTGRLFDQKGDNFVMYPSFVVFAIGLYILSQTHQGFLLLAAGAFIGLGFGTYMSCAQAIAINISPSHRIGLATSTFFIFMDLGVGFGPLLLGTIIPFLQFRGLYEALAIVVIICMFLYYFLHGSTSKNKEQVDAKTSNIQ